MRWERVGGEMICSLQITIAGDRNAFDVKSLWIDCPNQMVTIQMTPTDDRLIYPCWNTMWIA
jgi:hypothetical protein